MWDEHGEAFPSREVLRALFDRDRGHWSMERLRLGVELCEFLQNGRSLAWDIISLAFVLSFELYLNSKGVPKESKGTDRAMMIFSLYQSSWSE